tara:strand:+ start:6561 stop:7016 length:456 start_codon:yes stop_codon:yes gene_type:complete
MNHTIVNLPESYVLGKTIITDNSKNGEEIGALAGEFQANNVAATITHRSDENVLAIYTDYESDYTAPYRYVMGCKVDSTNEQVDGLYQHTIPAGKYAVFTSQGPFPTALVETWQWIWANFETDRAYTADFEVYTPDFNPADAKIDIYIALK